MEEGYILWHRQAKYNFLHPSQQRRKFTEYEAFQNCVELAYFKNQNKLIQGKKILIERGSFDTSAIQLAERWKWDRETVERFLQLLEKEEMITRTKVNPKNPKSATILKINNYDTFQPNLKIKSTMDATMDATPNNERKNIDCLFDKKNKQLKLTGKLNMGIPDKIPFDIDGKPSEFIFFTYTQEEINTLFEKFGEDIISEVIGDLEKLARDNNLQSLQPDKTVPLKTMYKFCETKFNKRNTLCKTTR